MAQLAADSTLQPTALVHEAWLRLSQRESPWQGRGHFLAGAVTAMRHILIDQARRKSRQRHGGGLTRAATVTVADLAAPDPDERLLLIDEAVHALEKADPRCAEVVVARFFGGLTTHEIAQALDISERGVDRHWAAAKVWLFRWMQSAAKA
jgi:RNA polymerase sigma factor (TIGR02999 family)